MAQKSFSETRKWLQAARSITEALPYMRRYAGKTFVIKYGGHAMGNAELAALFAKDIVLLKQVGINPVVVHGGGPQIGQMLERLKIQSEFVDGLRVTDAATVEIVEMVLSGTINKQIVTAINAAGGMAIGLSGKDGQLIQARRLRHTPHAAGPNAEPTVDLGFVGEPSQVNPQVLTAIENAGMIPVVAPIGVGPEGETFNINADTAAGAVAAALQASRLLMLTDVMGVLDAKGTLIPELTIDEVYRLTTEGTISGGMIPKIETCVNAVQGGVESASIIDGRIEHAILLEIFTEHGCGTLVRKQT